MVRLPSGRARAPTQATGKARQMRVRIDVRIDESESSTAHLRSGHGDTRSGLIKAAKCGRRQAEGQASMQVGASWRAPPAPCVQLFSAPASISECEYRVTCAGVGMYAHDPRESIQMSRNPEYLTDEN